MRGSSLLLTFEIEDEGSSLLLTFEIEKGVKSHLDLSLETAIV